MRNNSSSTTVMAAVALLIMLLTLGGCGLTQTRPFKETKRLYYTYINSPVEVDLSDPKTLGEADSRLASRLMEIDRQLFQLERILESTSTTVDQDTVDLFFQRFPWLTSLLIISPEAQVMASIPPVPMKQLELAPLLEQAPKAFIRDLRVNVQENPLGPEILLARPFYNGQDLQALLTVTFDMRSLLAYTGQPDDLIIRTPDILLWSGDKYYDETALAGVNWQEELQKHSYGTVGSGNNQYTWLVRYMGYTPLIFATPAQ